jgi:hypothetical protein
MLLESIKDITKDGRIITGDGLTKDENYKGYEIKETAEGYIVTSPERKKESLYRSPHSLEDVKKSIDNRISKNLDSQYTKAEYQLKILSLTNKLQKAKQLGDSEEAKELQKKIDELKALESGVQDGWGIIAGHKGWKILREYAESTGRPTGKYMAAPENFRSGVEFDKIQGNSIDEVKSKIDKIKSNDTEAKITDLTEKAKQARAQGYAADQYEVEIEKLKAKDKKTKDGRSKKEILEDIGEVKLDIQECKREHRFYGDLSQELKDLEQELKDTSDSKDILTQDPNK